MKAKQASEKAERDRLASEARARASSETKEREAAKKHEAVATQKVEDNAVVKDDTPNVQVSNAHVPLDAFKHNDELVSIGRAYQQQIASVEPAGNELAREVSKAASGNKKKRARARAKAKRELDESCEQTANNEFAGLAAELQGGLSPNVTVKAK